jgi:hypothetical protein
LGDASKKIITLKRYHMPSQKDVRDLVMSSVRRFYEKDPSFMSSLEDKDCALRGRIEDLPEIVVEALAKRDEGIIKHLDRHYNAPNRVVGANYMSASGGVVSKDILDQISETEGSSFDRFIMYDAAASQFSDRNWGLEMKLGDGERLVNPQDMKYLMSKGVTACDDFKITKEGLDYDYVANEIAALYRGLDNPLEIRKLRDCTEEITAGGAMDNLHGLGKCVSSKIKMFESVGGIIRDIIKGSSDRPHRGFDFK